MLKSLYSYLLHFQTGKTLLTELNLVLSRSYEVFCLSASTDNIGQAISKHAHTDSCQNTGAVQSSVSS